MSVYVGLYRTDDSRARADCEQTLVFGEKVDSTVHQNDFNWKHVTLPCPSCGFEHHFKREVFWEDVKLGIGEL